MFAEDGCMMGRFGGVRIGIPHSVVGHIVVVLDSPCFVSPLTSFTSLHFISHLILDLCLYISTIFCFNFQNKKYLSMHV